MQSTQQMYGSTSSTSSSFPSFAGNLTAVQVAGKVVALGAAYEAYRDIIVVNNIDGESLSSLQRDEIAGAVDDLDIDIFCHRRNIALLFTDMVRGSISSGGGGGGGGGVAAAPLSSLTAAQVAEKVKTKDKAYSKYEAAIVDNHIDGRFISSLQEDEIAITLKELGVMAFHKTNIEAVFKECSTQHQAVGGGAQAPAINIGGGNNIGEEKVWWERVGKATRVDEQQVSNSCALCLLGCIGGG